MNSVIVVDDDPKIRESLAAALSRQNYHVSCIASPEEFIDDETIDDPAVVIADIFFGGKPDGERILSHITRTIPDTQCIVISGESDIQKTLDCLKAGAVDFIEKPVSLPRLFASVKNAVNVYHYRKQAQSRSRILGTSGAVVKMVQRIRKLAPLNETVLVYGESGCGKELVAENLHLWSHRNASPIIKVNCTALNPHLIESELFGYMAGSFTGAGKDRKGLFAAAHGGTIFIDEIGDFPVYLQSKILRVLQEQSIMPVGSVTEIPIDVRFIFATHRNLEAMAAEGTFREDLLYRISTFTIAVPPLRNRTEDIDILSDFFIRQFCIRNNIAPKNLGTAARMKLAQYHYPGNIRELSSIVKNAVFNCENETIEPIHIDFGISHDQHEFWKKVDSLSFDEAVSFFKGTLLSRRFEQCSNNIKKTAASLSILPNNLYRLLKAHGILYSESTTTASDHTLM